MFEKEAEEYVIKKHNIDITKQPIDFSLRCEFTEDFTDFQNGAEVGYNKANEWHYVKNGDLPKEIKEYLVYKIDGYGCKSIQVMQFNNKHCWCANCQNVIKAWKEIKLPKEKI